MSGRCCPERITKRIEDGLSTSMAVVIFLSPSSIKSPWVKSELHHALHETISTGKIKVLPVILSAIELPPLLKNYRCIDVGRDARAIAAEIGKAVSKAATAETGPTS
jgi:hypothetical protein